MKKIYQAPQTSICALMSHGPISGSMKFSIEKVEDTNDIGFTKEYDFDEDELWDD